MAKQIWKPAALMGPVPAVLVTCGSMENPLVLTVAWTGIISTRPPMTYISVRPERNSYGVIAKNSEFAINLTTESMAHAVDFCGVRSGSNTDKFALSKITPEASSQCKCPIIAESPLSLECKVKEIKHLGSHDMFIAEIVAVDVDECLLDKSGKLCLEKAHLLAYAHGVYYALGQTLGTFGWSVRKKAKTGAKKRR